MTLQQKQLENYLCQITQCAKAARHFNTADNAAALAGEIKCIESLLDAVRNEMQ